MVSAQIVIETTTKDHRHTAMPLDYETWEVDDRTGLIRIKGYDPDGTSIMIVTDMWLLHEIVFGRINDGEQLEDR